MMDHQIAPPHPPSRHLDESDQEDEYISNPESFHSRRSHSTAAVHSRHNRYKAIEPDFQRVVCWILVGLGWLLLISLLAPIASTCSLPTSIHYTLEGLFHSMMMDHMKSGFMWMSEEVQVEYLGSFSSNFDVS